MTDKERITHLEARIAQLEGRLAILEARQHITTHAPMPPITKPYWQPYTGWKPGDLWCASGTADLQGAHRNTEIHN